MWNEIVRTQSAQSQHKPAILFTDPSHEKDFAVDLRYLNLRYTDVLFLVCKIQ